MSYKHGVYGQVAETHEATSVAQGTIPVYIGSAPVHRINTEDFSEYVNQPILISSYRDARELGLYSEDWKTYTLCEAIYAHFLNGDNSCAPIILINTLNPLSDYATKATEAQVTLKKVGTKFVGYIEDPLLYAKDISFVAGEATGATLGTPTLSYSGDKLAIECDVTFSSGKENTTAFTVTATYKRIEFSTAKFTEEAIEEALNSLDYCEQLTGVVPNVLAAPCISEVPELHSRLVQKAIDKISGKWNLICLSDIPSATCTTYDEAKTWKNTNGYDSKYEKTYWPSLAYGDKVFHASVIGAYLMQSIDTSNSDVPYVSTSNKALFCDRAVVGNDNETLKISEQKANELNKVGITTVNIINRELRVWGSHMANYDYDNVASISPEDRFDASVRMSMYILNYLQKQYINEIDESFTQKDVDSIVNSAQTWLDSLVNSGMLLYANISFNNESNSDASLANGDFVFDLEVTYAVIAKSITFKLQYTSTGLSVLTTEGGDE